MNEWMCMEYEWRTIDIEKPKCLERYLSQCQFVHHKINPNVRGDGSLTNRLRCCKAGSAGGAASGVFSEYHDEAVSFSCHQRGSFESRTFQIQSIIAAISTRTFVEIECANVDCIHLVQNRLQWYDVLKAKKFSVFSRSPEFCYSAQPILASKEGFSAWNYQVSLPVKINE